MNIKEICVPFFGAKKKKRSTICMTMSLNAKVSPSTRHTVEPHTCIFVRLFILFEISVFCKSRVWTWREPQVSGHKTLFGSYLWALITNWLKDVNMTFLSVTWRSSITDCFLLWKLVPKHFEERAQNSANLIPSTFFMCRRREHWQRDEVCCGSLVKQY